MWCTFVKSLPREFVQDVPFKVEHSSASIYEVIHTSPKSIVPAESRGLAAFRALKTHVVLTEKKSGSGSATYAEEVRRQGLLYRKASGEVLFWLGKLAL